MSYATDTLLSARDLISHQAVEARTRTATLVFKVNGQAQGPVVSCSVMPLEFGHSEGPVGDRQTSQNMCRVSVPLGTVVKANYRASVTYLDGSVAQLFVHTIDVQPTDASELTFLAVKVD